MKWRTLSRKELFLRCTRMNRTPIIIYLGQVRVLIIDATEIMERFLSNNLNDKMYSGSVKITTMDNFTSFSVSYTPVIGSVFRENLRQNQIMIL
jgi:hypothetical protein